MALILILYLFFSAPPPCQPSPGPPVRDGMGGGLGRDGSTGREQASTDLLYISEISEYRRRFALFYFIYINRKKKCKIVLGLLPFGPLYSPLAPACF